MQYHILEKLTLLKGVSDLETCVGYFARPERSCEKSFIFSCPNSLAEMPVVHKDFLIGCQISLSICCLRQMGGKIIILITSSWNCKIIHIYLEDAYSLKHDYQESNSGSFFCLAFFRKIHFLSFVNICFARSLTESAKWSNKICPFGLCSKKVREFLMVTRFLLQM